MKRRILRNKAYLYLTEFFAGMSVMAVELGASRLLAPYFSSSQIVWTIIIGTIMIAMALGNLYGGKKADQNPDPDKLYARIIVAAVWIALIPVVGKYIILAVSGLLIFTINSNYLVVAAFVACMIVFVFPLFLLGTVTPSLVKYTIDSLDEGGSVVGRLNAANTIGSILGTFLPTFVTIPAVGTAITFLLFSGVLLILAILYFLSPNEGESRKEGDASDTKKKTGNGIRLGVGIVIFLGCCIFGHESSFAFWQKDLTFEGESIYNYLQVYEDDRQAVLSTNVLFGVQSVYRKEKSLTGMYYDYAMASVLMAQDEKTGENGGKKPTDILILGMGTGTFATQCGRYFDNIQTEGVEIDQKITDLAHQYFALDENIQVTTYDGRAFLAACDKTYDVIMVDAYQDITIPFQMSSKEFFTMVREHLNPDGVMVVNLNMRGQKEGNINQYLSDTIAGVFDSVSVVKVPGTTNQELFACCDGEITDRMDRAVRSFEERSEGTEGEDAQPELLAMMQKVNDEMEVYEAGNYLLTDDKAPVELLGMQVIDDIIREEVSYYKEIYEEEGLKGLLDVL
ncbi:MAG: fused MFS/spermidine synthase [Lachnospiraceae bacterium]|nr:fused MFS/spermidine synthase [Lachnospiraceae bacterium]